MSRKPPLLIVALVAIDVLLCLAYIANYLAGASFEKLTQGLDLDGEDSLATWYSSTKLFCIAVVGGIYAYRQFGREPRSWLLLGLPAVFLLMSIDEALQIHEWIGKKSNALLPGGDRKQSVFDNTGIWMFVVGIPFLIAFLIWARTLVRFASKKPGSLRLFVIGMLVLLAGAAGIEIFANFTQGVSRVLQVSLEEAFEMIGASIILWGVSWMAEDSLPNWQSPTASSAEQEERIVC